MPKNSSNKATVDTEAAYPELDSVFMTVSCGQVHEQKYCITA